MDKTLAVPPVPPLVEKRPESKTVHGVTLVDDYAWLKADNWQQVLRDPSALPADIRQVLEGENLYAQALLAPGEELRQTLVKEMRGRIKEDDAEVPTKDGDWLYYARHVTGGQHPLFCRTDLTGENEVVLLDGEKEGHGKAFFDIGMVRHSPDHRLVAWSVDEKGSELYSIRVRDPATGTDGPDLVPDTDGNLVWMRDSSGFYYVRVDANHRTAQVFRHIVGTDSAKDVLVFEELDPAWFVNIRRSQSSTFAIVSVSDHDSSECHLLDLGDPLAAPQLIEARARGLRYEVEDHGDRLFIRTNADGAEDFKIVSAPLATPSKAYWQDFVAHVAGRMIITCAIFKDYLVRLERENGLPSLKIHEFVTGTERTVAFAEEAYHLGLAERFEYATTLLRFTYSSMTTPREIYDYDLATEARVLRKRQILPSGHDPADYVTKRLFATAADGASVPVSILYHKNTKLDGSAPVLLYGYGAYGHPTPASFSSGRLSLVDRGFIFAIAHIRGGTDKGWHWYTDGKLDKKTNTFADFVTAGRHLVAQGLTREGRIVAQGGSAGGMLMGAVANLAPELFAGIIADVPFVDVLNTMLDAELPLTPPEWLEWGNPILDPQAFATIRSYSPYDNVAAKIYPPILALGGLTDPRVTYWEPAKWVARLRATMAGGGPILLMTNMGAGHGGASGRFDRLSEVANEYAFALACIDPGFTS
ncbi:S9 family peptidase [Beijerinckia indica]|uniref:Oligopeptidase B n=1 Tax=Beijerinckia indica subsp. indica (strain ATCC 9039 / DSM 1715 / NCIMB 8712) TaxID=395963 RepID=B2IC20_BEII9|nr:S9 family peptidase [Beijerinckia indica]ACB95275.1 Oligopeptidase B [Beijerinckia indica subsp. indica ATCC 9039]